MSLARALVNRPTVLLLDEPLAALDLKLRKEMQLELKTLQREVGDHVRPRDPRPGGGADDERHDRRHARRPDPAAGLAPRLYERPVNRFVAAFIGSSNFLDGTLAERRTQGSCGRTDRGRVAPSGPATVAPGSEVTVAIRPERMVLRQPVPRTVPQREGRHQILGTVHQGTYLGDQTEYRIETDQAGEVVSSRARTALARWRSPRGPATPHARRAGTRRRQTSSSPESESTTRRGERAEEEDVTWRISTGRRSAGIS